MKVDVLLQGENVCGCMGGGETQGGLQPQDSSNFPEAIESGSGFFTLQLVYGIVHHAGALHQFTPTMLSSQCTVLYS
jgi:hypothetical protein